MIATDDHTPTAGSAPAFSTTAVRLVPTGSTGRGATYVGLTAVPRSWLRIAGVPKPPRIIHRLPGWIRSWRPPVALGACPPDATRLRCVIDTSGSVVSKVGVQHALLVRLADHLARACDCGRCTLEVISFGRSTPSDTTSSGAVPWTAPAAATAMLLAPPFTGSCIAGAVRDLETRGEGITVISSDFELFDPDVAGVLSRAAAVGPGLAAVIHTAPSAALRASGLEIVEIGRDTDRTALVDTLATTIAAHRLPPKPPRRARRSRGRGGDEVGDGGAPRVGRRRRKVPGTVAALLVAGLLCTVGAAAWGRHHDGGSRLHPNGPTAASGLAAVSGGGAGAPTAPFDLPDPRGNRARTVPAATVWLVDGALESSELVVLGREFPRVVDYQQQWALPADTTEVGTAGELQAVSTLSRDVVVARVQGQAEGVIAAVTAQLEGVGTPVDRAVVVVTDRPDRWLPFLPVVDYPVPITADGHHPEIRWYLVTPTPAASPAANQPLPHRGPVVLPVDPRVPGQLAKGLAHAWTDNTTAQW